MSISSTRCLKLSVCLYQKLPVTIILTFSVHLQADHAGASEMPEGERHPLILPLAFITASKVDHSLLLVSRVKFDFVSNHNSICSLLPDEDWIHFNTFEYGGDSSEHADSMSVCPRSF